MSHYCSGLTVHYAAATLEQMKTFGIDFVGKEVNPPNCPELRPIERYWATIKWILRNDGREAQCVDEFKKMWSSASRKVTKKTVERLMKGVRQKVHQFHK